MTKYLTEMCLKLVIITVFWGMILCRLQHFGWNWYPYTKLYSITHQ